MSQTEVHLGTSARAEHSGYWDIQHGLAAGEIQSPCPWIQVRVTPWKAIPSGQADLQPTTGFGWRSLIRPAGDPRLASVRIPAAITGTSRGGSDFAEQRNSNVAIMAGDRGSAPWPKPGARFASRALQCAASEHRLVAVRKRLWSPPLGLLIHFHEARVVDGGRPCRQWLRQDL